MQARLAAAGSLGNMSLGFVDLSIPQVLQNFRDFPLATVAETR
jgi:hypothetical protein